MHSGEKDRSRSPHLVTTFDVQRGAKPTLIHGDATPRAEVLADGPVKTMSKQPIGFRKALRRRHDGVISTASSRRLVALRLALTDVVRGIGDRASLLSRERRQMRREHLSRAAACTLSFHSYASRRGRRVLVVGVVRRYRRRRVNRCCCLSGWLLSAAVVPIAVGDLAALPWRCEVVVASTQ